MIVLLALSAPVLADQRHAQDVVETTTRLRVHARELRTQADRFVSEHPQFWRATVHRREDAVPTLFAIHRLVGSAEAFHDLVKERRLRFTYYVLPAAYEALVADTRQAGELLRRAAGNRNAGRGYGRWAPDPFNHFAKRDLLPAYREVAEDVESMGYVSHIERLPYVPPTPPLEISELRCYKRKKYTYRMNVCIEGRDLDRSRLRVEFVKRRDPRLDPWQREVQASELQSVKNLRDGRQERCYFLRQIGKEIRRHQGDNVFVVLERPKTRRRVVEACWEDEAYSQGPYRE
jgi:hypothetical protein